MMDSPHREHLYATSSQILQLMLDNNCMEKLFTANSYM
jgi:hypothetical protein